MTEQDGHPPAHPSAGPDEPAAPLAEAAAALGFSEAARAHPDPPPRAASPTEAAPLTTSAPPASAPPASAPTGVPPRPQPLPPPRPVYPPAGAPAGAVPARPAPPRPVPSGRPVARARRAKLVLKRIDPWSVFLYSVVASIFIGLATLVAVALLYAVLAKLGVLSSLNTLIGDVTSEPGASAAPADFFSLGKVMTFATLIAALDVVLITALSTLAAFLYNACASLTGGIEVTLTDQS